MAALAGSQLLPLVLRATLGDEPRVQHAVGVVRALRAAGVARRQRGEARWSHFERCKFAQHRGQREQPTLGDSGDHGGEGSSHG